MHDGLKKQTDDPGGNVRDVSLSASVSSIPEGWCCYHFFILWWIPVKKLELSPGYYDDDTR